MNSYSWMFCILMLLSISELSALKKKKKEKESDKANSTVISNENVPKNYCLPTSSTNNHELILRKPINLNQVFYYIVPYIVIGIWTIFNAGYFYILVRKLNCVTKVFEKVMNRIVQISEL